MDSGLRAEPRRAPVEGELDFTGAEKRRGSWAWVAAGAVAAVFLAVVVLAYWQGGDSSVPGVPPLVKADPGPTKIKPDQPGGQTIPFQDLTVYDRLGQGGQKPQAEKLLPPPEAPVQRPLVADAPAAPVAPAPVPQVLAPPPVSVQPAAPASSPPTDKQVAALTKPPANTNSSGPAALAPKPAIPGQTSASPIPIVPATIVPAAPPAAAPPQVAAIAPPAAPAKSAFGSTYRIQVGLADSADAAAAEWGKLRERFPQTLGPLRMSPEKVDVPGKGIAYRLEAGPLDEGKAKAACAKMSAQGAGCVAVGPTASASVAVVPSAGPTPAINLAQAGRTADGGYRIQLGSVRTPDAVGAEWSRLKGRFPELLAPLNMSSEKVEVADKGTFYRIRVGPLDQDGAKSACDHLKAQGVTCIVVKS